MIRSIDSCKVNVIIMLQILNYLHKFRNIIIENFTMNIIKIQYANILLLCANAELGIPQLNAQI